MMEVFPRPIWKYQQTHQQAHTTANGNGVEAVMCDLQDIVNTVARHSYQIKRQEKYHNTIVIVLLYVGNEPHVCSYSSCKIENEIYIA
jgi:hypothetical protein